MNAVAIAISNLSDALDRDAPGAVRLAEKVGPILWMLAGSPKLLPPSPPPAAAEAARKWFGEESEGL